MHLTYRLTIKGHTMHAEIVVVGTELLLGQIIDTNGAYLA